MTVKIFVVSMSRAVERRKFMGSQLRKLNMDFEFIDACDARKITDDEMHNVNKNKFYQHQLTKGEVACVRSHAKACKALSDSKNYNYGLIVEDDVIFSAKLQIILNELQQLHLSNDVTLLYASLYKPVTLHKQHDLSSDYSLVSPDNVEGLFGTVAYFISKNKAREFYPKILPARKKADDWKHYIESGCFSNINLVYPFPVLHAELLSTVNEKTLAKNNSLRSHFKNFIYYNKIFPFYEFFIWKRRKDAEARQRKNITAPEFNCKKTFRL